MTDKFVFDLNPEGTPFSTITNVGAVHGGDAFLLTCGMAEILFDSGFAFCGPKLVENLERELGGRPLDYILLSHSHYDHAPGSAYCKARWPNAQVISSEYAAKIFTKPGARAVMRELDDAAAAQHGMRRTVDLIDSLKTDLPLRDYETISLNGLCVQCIPLPGHTKCSVGFYFKEHNFLIASESIGVFSGGDVISPAFLVGYQMSVDSIRRVMEMDVKNMLLPHYGILHGEKCREYLETAMLWTVRCRDALMDAFNAGKSREEMIGVIRDMFYVGTLLKYQPEKAFLVNAGHMVDLIIREFNLTSRE
jgi:glyoxylase-like metal-dependent hydrolase (beta-lactamase superfamily II)